MTHESWGHPALNRSTCVNDLIVGYLTAGEEPADGTTCRPDVVPFAPALSRAQTELPAGRPFW